MLRKASARWVLAFDGTDHVLIDDGSVVFDGDTVVAVGRRTDVQVASDVDLGRALITPGFVDLNALADVDTTILGFSAARDRRDGAWSRAYAETGRRDVLSMDQRLASARFAFAQLLLSGITTALPVTSLLFREWAEEAEEFKVLAGLATELGLRLVLGPSFRSAVNVVEADGRFGQFIDEEAGRNGLEKAIGFVEGCAESGPLVSALLVPSTIETCSDELIKRTADAARDLGVPFRLHCCQSRLEAEVIWRRSRRSAIGHLEALGVLGPAALLPHALDLGGPDRDPAIAEADMAALADRGATIVHCPLVVGRSGRRLESFARFRERGVRIGLGTDTAPPDMLMNLQMGLATARTFDSEAPTPADFVRAATLEAAAAIGRPDLGRLAKGARADFVAWDLGALAAQPVFDPVEALFLMPPGAKARDVWVAGRQVVRDGAVPGFDEKRVIAEVDAIFAALLDSFAERHWQNRPWRELFPPAFRSFGTVAEAA